MAPATRSQTAFRQNLAGSEIPPFLGLSHPDDGDVRHDLTDGNNVWSSAMQTRHSTRLRPPGPQSAEYDDDMIEPPRTSRASSSGSNGSRKRRTRHPPPPHKEEDEGIPDEPPRFTINLSLPPEQRYLAVCAAFQPEIADLVPLFDEVVGGMLHFLPLTWIHRVCRLVLRGVYDREEQRELKGVSHATGVKMYLLVCFNVLLDLFMGCSSGGAAVRAGSGKKGGSKMVHFRTLDWDMPSLRRVVVQLDFVRETDGPVFARSITYAGYVGVLTGVREGLSMSLNFRPNRIDNGVWWADAKYVFHLVCVLLGWRRSISSTIRGFLLPRERRKGWMVVGTKGNKEELLDYEGVVCAMAGDEGTGKRPLTTTACYFCVCSGEETTVIEKDRISAKKRSGDEFIVVTNTDEAHPSTPLPGGLVPEEKPTAAVARSNDLEAIVAEARDRQECALHNWRNLQSANARRRGLQHISGDERKRLASVEDVVYLTQQYPTTNECTHFAAVMDPTEGRVVWCRRWIDPVDAGWIRGHMSATW